MYTSTRLILLAAALIATAACNMDAPSPDSAEEVGEEAAEFVEAVGPDSEVPGDVAAPVPLTSAQETLELAEVAGGLTSMSPSSATAVIDNWIGTLRANPDVDDADDLVEDLTELRTLLAATPIDGEAVGEVLEELAEETDEAADDADDEAVERLAEALEEAAEALD